MILLQVQWELPQGSVVILNRTLISACATRQREKLWSRGPSPDSRRIRSPRVCVCSPGSRRLRSVSLGELSPEQQHDGHLGVSQKCKFSGPSLDQLHQKVWGWSPEIWGAEGGRREAEFATPKICLWGIDHINLVIFKKQKTQKKNPFDFPPNWLKDFR